MKPPKPPELGDLELLFQARLAGEAVEVGLGHRCCGPACKLDPAFEPFVREQRVGEDHLAWTQAHELAGKIRSPDLAHLELAGGDVERGERHDRVRLGVRAGNAEQRRQIVARFRIEKGVLGQGPWRDEPHHVAAHDRLGAALPRLRRILELLGDGDPVAEPDQALQILIRPVDGHPAHGDVLAQVLAALGQHDRQRGGGDDRIVEEELVEIAHAIPEQAVGIGRLDLEVLGHGRARLATRPRWSRRHGGLGGRSWKPRAASLLCSCPSGRHGPRLPQTYDPVNGGRLR